MPSEYDELAWFYDRYWGTRFHNAVAPALERLLFSRVTPPARILDVCCGTGHLTERILERGYGVIGVDVSLEMLRFAKARAPAARFICADVTSFGLKAGCRAAVSTFDSVNHILSDAGLRRMFASVGAALERGGLFVFDVNTEQAYRGEWGKSSAQVDQHAAVFIRGGYDPGTSLGETLITTFKPDGQLWRRADVRIVQRSLERRTLITALQAAGFGAIDLMPASDAGVRGEFAVGRLFVRARRDR
jgi:SAM-dependent methyltransferase